MSEHATADYCFKCGNDGFEDEVCPSCGREPKSLNLNKMTAVEVKTFIKKTKEIVVPEEYIGVEWTADLFWKYHRGVKRNKLLEKFIDKLTEVHDLFATGILPAKGAFIIAPSTYSKETFAFSCMQQALKHGFTVAPLLDTLDLKRVLVLASENPNYKLDGWLDYDNYINSDVMFITVTKTEYHQNAFRVIQEVLGRRSRRGLGTFIISQFELDEIARWDKRGNFLKMNNLGREANFKKFPAVIGYREWNKESEGK